MVWLSRWPTRQQSKVAVTLGVLCIVAWSSAQPSPAVAALGCTATAVTGGYIAFFHSNRLLLLNFLIALTAAVGAAVRLADRTDFATAATAFWLIWLLNISVSLAIRGITHAMGEYAVRSDEDPLTGLLNRRGFEVAVKGAVAAAHPGDTHLAILMVDLDDFKLINDTQGHDAGDRVLLAVAELLRHHVPPSGAVCRAGGEEFLIALTTSDPEATGLATRLCTAIARLSHAVTASIGHASAELKTVTEPENSVIDDLVRAADTAMYAAKRNGGNQVQLVDLDAV